MLVAWFDVTFHVPRIADHNPGPVLGVPRSELVLLLLKLSIKEINPPANFPNALDAAAPNAPKTGDIFLYYANLVCDSNTVTADATVEVFATFVIVTLYASILEAFPELGAVPPCHLGVTEEPST